MGTVDMVELGGVESQQRVDLLIVPSMGLSRYATDSFKALLKIAQMPKNTTLAATRAPRRIPQAFKFEAGPPLSSCCANLHRT
jgi:hypothetical protein